MELIISIAKVSHMNGKELKHLYKKNDNLFPCLGINLYFC